nr:uncharacterized protein LOC113724458 [Coffea arabica]
MAGEIGVCSMAKVFDAFFVKLWWNFRQKKSLWAECLHAKYCKGVHPCLAEEGAAQSHIWRRLCSVQRLAEEHISWILWEGSMDFWHDNWLGLGALYQEVEIFQEHRVLRQGRIERVAKIPSPSPWSSDRMVWALASDGAFSVSSAYSLVEQEDNCLWVFSQVWLEGCPIKISFLMLRLLRLCIPLIGLLRHVGVQGPSKCHCCAEPEEEEVNHIFCTGELAQAVWGIFQCSSGEPVVSSFRHMAIRWWLQRGQNKYVKFVYRLPPMLVCWELWKVRNRAVFDGRKMGCTEVVDQVLQQIQVAPVAGFKLNSDGCARGNPGTSGDWGVVRDCKGQVVLGYLCFFGSLTSLHAELEAMLFGVRLCVTRGL